MALLGFMVPIGGWELVIIALIGLMLLGAAGVIIFIVMKVAGGASRPPAGQDQRIRCPECAEWIIPEAQKCRFCGARFDGRE